MNYMPVFANSTNWFSFIAQFVLWYNFHTFYGDLFMCIININVKHLRVPWKICKRNGCKTSKYMENYLSSIFHWLDHIARKMFHKSINKSKWTSLISSVGWILCYAVFPFNSNLVVRKIFNRNSAKICKHFSFTIF